MLTQADYLTAFHSLMNDCRRLYSESKTVEIKDPEVKLMYMSERRNLILKKVAVARKFQQLVKDTEFPNENTRELIFEDLMEMLNEAEVMVIKLQKQISV
jgi:hypothetical protein